VCFWKNCFVHFFFPFFGYDIRVNIKNVFSLSFRRFFPIFFRTIRVFLKKLFGTFLCPLFWTRYSCVYRKRFFALFSDDIFATFFSSHYSCVSGKMVSRIFSSPFLSHDIRVNIKNAFSHFFRRFISQQFFFALFVCFWKNCFVLFFVPIFWSRYSCEYKKSFFALFTDDFFPTFLVRTICVFLGKLFRSFFVPIFRS